MTIAKHFALSWLRRNPRGRTVALEATGRAFDPIDDNADPEVVIEREYIWYVLAKIEPPVLREVLVLHVIGGFSRAVIADWLGYTEGTVTTYLSQARKQFCQLYYMMGQTE